LNMNEHERDPGPIGGLICILLALVALLIV
jgi:hypothetical protein